MSIDATWEYNCPQFFNFLEVNENDDKIDEYFDSEHEPRKIPKFQRVLREVSNISNHHEPNDKKRHVERHDKSKNVEVGHQLKTNAPHIVFGENLFGSPLSKRPRMSSPSLHAVKRKQWSSRRRNSFTHDREQQFKLKKAAVVHYYLERESVSKTHPMQTRQDVYKEIDFVSTLRQYSPKKGPAHKLTKPSPFKLTEKPKKTVVSEFQSVAQQINAFQTKTPERFRTKAEVKNRGKGGTHSDSKTSEHKIPLVLLKDIASPNLRTKQRSRPVTCLSQKEIEEKEIEEMKKFQFKALPLNPVIFQRNDIGLHKTEPKPTTVVEPFNFHSERNSNKKPDHEIKLETFTFHARPVPKGLFEKTIGLPEIAPRPITQPHSPSFVLHSRPHQVTLNQSEKDASSNQTKLSVGSTVSQCSLSSTIKWEPKPTKLKPFSFEQRDQEMITKKAQKIKEFIEQEKQLREFKARPLPSLDPSGIPPKTAKSPTKCKPFPNQLSSVIKRSQLAKKWIQQVEEDLEKQRQMAVTKARKCTVTKAEPFIPKKSERSPVEPSDFELRTEIRARSRHEFDEFLRQKEEEMKAICKQRQENKEKEEAAALAAWQTENAYRANPIRRYKPLNSPKQLPLTVPQTPKFHSKK